MSKEAEQAAKEIAQKWACDWNKVIINGDKELIPEFAAIIDKAMQPLRDALDICKTSYEALDGVRKKNEELKARNWIYQGQCAGMSLEVAKVRHQIKSLTAENTDLKERLKELEENSQKTINEWANKYCDLSKLTTGTSDYFAQIKVADELAEMLEDIIKIKEIPLGESYQDMFEQAVQYAEEALRKYEAAKQESEVQDE
jgi:predicted nuclease with TOPRIM domain